MRSKHGRRCSASYRARVIIASVFGCGLHAGVFCVYTLMRFVNGLEAICVWLDSSCASGTEPRGPATNYGSVARNAGAISRAKPHTSIVAMQNIAKYSHLSQISYLDGKPVPSEPSTSTPRLGGAASPKCCYPEIPERQNSLNNC